MCMHTHVHRRTCTYTHSFLFPFVFSLQRLLPFLDVENALQLTGQSEKELAGVGEEWSTLNGCLSFGLEEQTGLQDKVCRGGERFFLPMARVGADTHLPSGALSVCIPIHIDLGASSILSNRKTDF